MSLIDEMICKLRTVRTNISRDNAQESADVHQVILCLESMNTPLVNEIPTPPTIREAILLEAIKCVTKDRNATHGAPEDNFKTIAKYWNTYVDARVKRQDYNGFFDEVDVAVMMLLMKVSRLAKSPEHQDHWVDIAGYAACGGGIATNS